ncbi:MAG: OmpA family protein [Flavobacteriales bacterium]
MQITQNRKTHWVSAAFSCAIVFLFSLSGCSTHFFLEGKALEERGAFMEAAEQYERAARGSNRAEVYEALIPIYLELNVHERALACMDSLENISGLTQSLLFEKGETLMSLGRYDEARGIYLECQKTSKVSTRLSSLKSIEERRADSIYFKVNKIEIISNSSNGLTVASSALPRIVGGELYFVAESPRNHSQRIGSETYIDNYTGNRLMDLWKGELKDNKVLFSEPLSNLNTEYHDGVVAHGSDVSDESGEPDISTGVLSKTYTPTSVSLLKKLGSPAGERLLHPIQLFKANLKTDTNGLRSWETGLRLGFCDERYMYAHPSISPDGTTLFFTSNMPGGYGGMDIWSSKRHSTKWGNPINLGPIVNTSRDEAFATMRHSDTLYFSSNGHSGLGGLDIIYATKTTNYEWTEIVDNLPYPVNSSGDDFGIQLDKEGFNGILSSDRDGTDALYHFSEYDPEITLFVEIIHEKDGSAWPGLEAALEHVGDKNSMNFISDNEGKWSTRILREKSYMIQCPGSFGYTADPFTSPEDQTIKSLTIIVPIPMVIEVGCMDPLALNYNSVAIVDDGLCEYTRTIEKPSVIIDVVFEEDFAEEIIEGDIVELNLQWDYDNADIRPSDLPIIKAFAKHLLENTTQRTLLISHCDSRATESYNDSLSQLRADAVKEELMRFNVHSSRIFTYGASEQFLLEQCKDDDNCDDSVHQANRRTTAKILRPEEKVYIHKVKAGQTLYTLAKSHNVWMRQVKDWNGLKSSKMRVGQDILIYLP